MYHDNKTGEGIAAVLAVAMVLFCLLLGVGGFVGYRYRAARQAAVAAEMQAALAAQQAEKSRRQLAAKQNQAALRFVAWNVESGGNDPAVIARQLAELGPYDVYGLTEVSPANTRRYTAAIGDSYKSLVTDTGGDDRMMIVYNADRLEGLEYSELESHDGVKMNDANLRHRSPLMARFREKHSGVEFLLVLNHLARGNAELRQEQAKALRLWAQDQELPIIGIGAYNFDFDIPTRRGNPAFDEFHLDYVWYWVEPEKLVDTNWADQDDDGVDDDLNSCQDFTFVAGKAKLWQSRSRVIVRDGDFPDNGTTSCHRPVELVVTPRRDSE